MLKFSGRGNSIDRGGFSGCANLTSVVIPESATSIGESAFDNCPLLRLTLSSESPLRSYPAANDIPCTFVYPKLLKLPDDLTVIDDGAFEGTDAVAVYLPEDCARIGSRAFASCPKMISIHIPNAQIEIADDAFAGIDSLRIFAPSEGTAAEYAQAHGFDRYDD